MGHYGPAWDFIVKYGPVWVYMGPYGPVLPSSVPIGRFSRFELELYLKITTHPHPIAP